MLMQCSALCYKNKPAKEQLIGKGLKLEINYFSNVCYFIVDIHKKTHQRSKFWTVISSYRGKLTLKLKEHTRLIPRHNDKLHSL